MGKLVDSDAVIAMLQKEANEWAAIARKKEALTRNRMPKAVYMSLAYDAAARDVEDFVKSQAEGNVPTDRVE